MGIVVEVLNELEKFHMSREELEVTLIIGYDHMNDT